MQNPAKLLSLTRNHLIIMMWLLTGHSYLKGHFAQQLEITMNNDTLPGDWKSVPG